MRFPFIGKEVSDGANERDNNPKVDYADSGKKISVRSFVIPGIVALLGAYFLERKYDEASRGTVPAEVSSDLKSDTKSSGRNRDLAELERRVAENPELRTLYERFLSLKNNIRRGNEELDAIDNVTSIAHQHMELLRSQRRSQLSPGEEREIREWLGSVLSANIKFFPEQASIVDGGNIPEHVVGIVVVPSRLSEEARRFQGLSLLIALSDSAAERIRWDLLQRSDDLEKR